jgi:uncharacterized protein (TIGR02246 family)
MGGQRVHNAVAAALEALNRALRERDPAFADSFHKNAILIGSEASDLSRGRQAIGAHFGEIYAAPRLYQFTWNNVEVARSGDASWFFADGELIVISPDGEARRPYNLTGVLVESKRGWRWRLFHGSEPLPS